MTGCSSPTTPQKRVFIDPSLASLIPADTNILAGVRVDLLSKHPAFPLVASQRSVAKSFHRNVGYRSAKPADLWQVLFVSNGRDSFYLGARQIRKRTHWPGSNEQRYNRAGGRFDYKGLSMVGYESNALMYINATTTAIVSATILRALFDARGQMLEVPDRFAPAAGADSSWNRRYGAHTREVQQDLVFPCNLINLRNIFPLLQTGTFYANVNTGFHLVASGTSPSVASALQLHDALQGLFALSQPGRGTNQSRKSQWRRNARWSQSRRRSDCLRYPGVLSTVAGTSASSGEGLALGYHNCSSPLGGFHGQTP